MALKQDYEWLSEHTYTLEDVRVFKAKALENRDDFYLRKGELLLIRLYINEGELNLASDLIKNNLESLDYRKDKENYRELLDEAIYCAINLQDYLMANKYLMIKKDIIDSEDKDSLNRFYLESAYVASLMNQMTRAVEHLKVILNNQPTLSMKSLALGNITKLYIAEKKPKEALDYLNQAIMAAQELNDEASMRYCDYLSISLSLLEQDKASAQSGFNTFFKDDQCEDEYLDFYNDYLNFLIDNKEVSKAYKLIKAHKERFMQNKDKYLRRNFLLTQINAFINLAKDSAMAQDAKDCLKSYRELNQLIELEDKTLEETSENVTKFQARSSLAVEFQSFKAALNEKEMYGAMASLMLKFDASFGPLECQLMFLDKNDSNNLKTFNYKAKRCFNRDWPFNKIQGSVFEQLLANPKMIYGKLNPGHAFVNPFTGRYLVEEGFEQIIAFPLFYKEDLMGGIVFLYKVGVELDKSKRDSLDVLTTLLTYKYMSLSQENDYQELLLYYNDLFDLDRPLFYYNIENHAMKLSLTLKQLLGVNQNHMDRNEYLSRMIVDSEELNHAYMHIAHQEDYTLHYIFKQDDQVVNYEEEGYKLTPNTYRCLIKKVEAEPEQEKIFDSDDYQAFLKNTSEHYTVVNMVLPANIKLDDLLNLSHLYTIFKVKNYLRVILKTNDLKEINNYIKTVISCYPYLKYNFVRYPKDVDDSKLIECALNYLWDEKGLNASFTRQFLLEKDQFYNAIDTCLSLKAVSLMCCPIQNTDGQTLKGYLLHYILPGLYEEYSEINTHHYEFYDLVINRLQDYTYEKPLYWMIPSLCIMHLLKNKYIKEERLKDRLIFIIQDDHDLAGLRVLGRSAYPIIISHNVLKSLTLMDLDILNIKGIFYPELDAESLKKEDSFVIQEKNWDTISLNDLKESSIDF